MKTKILVIILLLALVLAACKKSTKTGEHSSSSSTTTMTATDMEHTTQNSVDWEGEYKGIMPCEDCDGIELTIMLNSDYSFAQSATYIGKGGPYQTQGTFDWDETGSVIILKFDDGSQAKYRVGENTLTLLDAEGNLLGEDGYILNK